MTSCLWALFLDVIKSKMASLSLPGEHEAQFSKTSPADIWTSLFQCWRVDTLTDPFHSIVKGLGVAAGVKVRSGCNRTSEHLHITMYKTYQFEPSRISWARNIWSFVWPQTYKLNYASSPTFFACLNDVNKRQLFGTFEHISKKCWVAAVLTTVAAKEHCWLCLERGRGTFQHPRVFNTNKIKYLFPKSKKKLTASMLSTL